MSLPTPITRKESYLAAIAGEEVQVPEKPITREEAYLDAIVKGGGGGEIIVDPVPTEGSTNAVSSGGTYTALQGKLDASEKGTASGVAELDANGKVLSSQLPSFVDDVVEGYYDSETDRFYEESTFETVIDPVGGKSWVDIPANKSYRWTGTVYVRVDEGVQIGETSNSAFRGDWGKALKDTMGTGTLDTTAQTVIPAINEVKNDMPTALSDLTDDATHRLVTDTEKSTWNGKADTADITNAISALDVASVGGTGKYISEISEADGKINAVVGTMDDVPTENSNAPVKSGGIKTAIDDSVSLKTATGNPITLTDAANANAEKLLMTIEPIQDLHGYSKPWAGGGGKNKFGEENVVDRNTIHSFNVLTGTCKVTTTETNVQTQSEFYINDVSDWIGRTMTFSIKDYELSNNELKPYIVIYKNGSELTANLGNAGEGIVRTSASFTVTSDTTSYLILIRVSQGLASVGDYVQLNEIQLEIGSERTTFEPYANICPISGLTSGEVETTDGTDTNTASITFGQTVYGGSVNFKTGEVTVTHGIVDLGTLTYNSVGNNLFYVLMDSFGGERSTESIIALKASIYNNGGILGIGQILDYMIASNSSNYFYVKDPRANTAAELTELISGETLYFKLATPTTLTLTPAELELLKGNNTITANGAEISIEYYPDNAIGALAERVDDAQEQITTKANTTDVNVALAKKADVTTVTIPAFTPSQAGWRRICKIKPVAMQTVEGMQTAEGMIYAGGHWSNGQPPSASIAVNIMNTFASLTLLSSAIGNTNDIRITAMRLVRASGAQYWLDVYFPEYSFRTGFFILKFTGDIAVSDIQDPISITTDATAATDEVSLNQKVNGTVLTDKSSMIADLVSGKVDRFVSSSSGTSQTIDVGIVTTTNRMFLLSAGYSAQNGDYYVFGLIFIDYAGNIKYISLKDTQMTISVTYTDGIVSFTFSDPPYSNAVLIRLS